MLQQTLINQLSDAVNAHTVVQTGQVPGSIANVPQILL